MTSQEHSEVTAGNKRRNSTAFEVEDNGINIIPDGERTGRARDLAPLWAAAVMVFTGFILGGVIATLGLPLWASLLALVVGNSLWLLVGFVGTTGPEAGTANIVISRAAFGRRGNALPNLFAWFTSLGWQTVNAVIGTLALTQLFERLGMGTGTLQTAVALVLTLLITVSIGFWGHQTIVVVQRWATYLLAVGLIVTMGFGFAHIDWGYQGDSLAGSNIAATMLLAAAIAAGGVPMSYLCMPADYSRYLPRSVSKLSVTVWTAVGGFVPSTILMSFGILIGTTIDMTDPVNSLQQFLPGVLLVPFLVVIVLGVVANNFLNTYSCSLDLLALGARIERSRSVILHAVLVAILSAYALFVSDFIDSFINFLSLMLIWICPWGGVFVVDYLLRRRRYTASSLLDGGAPYDYPGGVNWRAVTAWVSGAVAAALTTNATLWASPLMTGTFGGADLSVPAGLIVGGGVYFLLARRDSRLRASVS